MLLLMIILLFDGQDWRLIDLVAPIFHHLVIILNVRPKVRHGWRGPPILHMVPVVLFGETISVLRHQFYVGVGASVTPLGLPLIVTANIVGLYCWVYDPRSDLAVGATRRLGSPYLAFRCARRLGLPEARPLALVVNGLLETLVRV